jgi:hypothetical protein
LAGFIGRLATTMTVLRQVAAHLDGWSDLRAEGVTWPSVHVAGSGASVLWQCVQDRWTGQVFDAGGELAEPVATIQTTIAEDASASEVADAIKAIQRMMRTQDAGQAQPHS